MLAVAREHAGSGEREAISSALDALRTSATLEAGQALREVLVTRGARARCTLMAVQYAIGAREALARARVVAPAIEAALSRLSEGVLESFRPRS